MEFEKKDELLDFLNSIIWALRTLEASGSLPPKEEVKTKFPHNDPVSLFSAISAYTGTLNNEELKGKVEQVLSEIEALRNTFLDPANTSHGIKRVPKEVLSLPQFAKRNKEAVKSTLESRLERLIREVEEAPIEEAQEFPLFTFTSRSSISPLYDEAAEIFLREGLLDKDGVSKDDYRVRLEDQKFKKKLEAKLAQKIGLRHFTEQIAAEIDLRFEEHDLDLDELDLGKRLIAEEAAEKIGSDNEKLAGIRRALVKSEEKEKRKMTAFFADLLLANEEFSRDEREEIARKAAEACFFALFSFELTTTYEVQVDPATPSFTLFTTDLETKNKVHEDFVVAPKEVSDFERAYDAEKRDFEILFGAHMTKV